MIILKTLAWIFIDFWKNKKETLRGLVIDRYISRGTPTLKPSINWMGGMSKRHMEVNGNCFNELFATQRVDVFTETFNDRHLKQMITDLLYVHRCPFVGKSNYWVPPRTMMYFFMGKQKWWVPARTMIYFIMGKSNY